MKPYKNVRRAQRCDDFFELRDFVQVLADHPDAPGGLLSVVGEHMTSPTNNSYSWEGGPGNPNRARTGRSSHQARAVSAPQYLERLAKAVPIGGSSITRRGYAPPATVPTTKQGALMRYTLSGVLANIRRDDAAWAEFQRAAARGPDAMCEFWAASMPSLGSHAIGLGALFAAWWSGEPRRVWMLDRAAAEVVASTGISFVPDRPPDGQPRAIIIEGARGPVFQGFDSVGIVWRDDHWGIVAIQTDANGDDVMIQDTLPVGLKFSEADDLPITEHDMAEWSKLDQQIAGEGWQKDRSILSPAQRAVAVALFQFAFAFWFFVATPGPWDVVDSADGPVRRNEHGKPVRVKGRPVLWWGYSSLTFRQPPEAEVGPGRDAPRDGLSLLPTVVRQHWRRLPTGKVVLVATHASNRWKRPDKIGTKIRVKGEPS